jgi:hypothetical protein
MQDTDRIQLVVMAQRKITLAIFSNKTKEEFLKHPKRMGHANRIHRYKPKDISVCYDQESKVVFGHALFADIDNGLIYKKIDIRSYDQQPYTNPTYNVMEVGVAFYPIEPVSVETINIECGIDPHTQLNKVMYKSFNGDSPQLAPWVNRVLLECLINNV